MKKETLETYHASLMAQYRDQIIEALIESESEHRTRMDLGKLNSKLQMITKSAKQDGLTQEEVDQLINETHSFHSDIDQAA